MGSKFRGSRKQDRRRQNFQEQDERVVETRQPKITREPLKPKTESQSNYMKAINGYQITFGVGPAGTGKTYIAAAMAADAFIAKKIDRIVITRPAVEAADEQMGFLPGELDEKYAPYLVPFLDVLNERLGKSAVEYMLKTGQLEAAPLAYMRGRTFNRCFMILDEAQNTTPGGMKMFLTRIGYDSSVVVNGDISQKDIPGPSGLTDAIDRLSFIPSIGVVRFGTKDVVRSGIVGEIVHAYENPVKL